jgi:hypothetical protein
MALYAAVAVAAAEAATELMAPLDDAIEASNVVVVAAVVVAAVVVAAVAVVILNVVLCLLE